MTQPTSSSRQRVRLRWGAREGVYSAASFGTDRAYRQRISSALAREYATTRPAAIRLNYGVQRSERGAMAVRAIALLPVADGWLTRGGRRIAAFHVGGIPLQQQPRWSGQILTEGARA